MQSLRQELRRLEEQLTALQQQQQAGDRGAQSESASDGLRRRHKGGTASDSSGRGRSGSDGEDEVSGPAGFPIWQVLLFALLTFFVGRLTAGVYAPTR